MVKTYLRYEPADTFGVIASSAGGARAVLLPASTALSRSVGARALVAAAPAIDSVLLWHVRHGTVLRRLADPAARATAGVVTALAVSVDGRLLAAGHADGSVRLYSTALGGEGAAGRTAIADGGPSVVPPLTTFNGHRSGVSALAFALPPVTGDDGDAGRRGPVNPLASARLVSGSNDGDIILWDLDSQRGLFRLHAAHTDAITSLVLFDAHGRSLVSTSKDGLVRVWDVATQHCVQTVVGHRGAIWGTVVDERQRLLITASADRHLRAFAVGRPDGHRDGAAPAGDTANVADAAAGVRDVTVDTPLLAPLGSVERKSIRGRAVSVAMVPAGVGGGAVLAVHANERAVELFAVRSAADAEKHRKRRRKRRAEKRKALAAGGGVPPDRVAPPVAGTDTDSDDAGGVGVPTDEDALCARDYLIHTRTMVVPHRVAGVSFLQHTTYGSDAGSGRGGYARAAASSASTTSVTMLVQQVNNCLEAHKVPVSPTVPVDADNARIATVDAAGHRGAIRGLALSPDGATLLSAAACGGVKFWDAGTASLLRSATLPGRATTASFLPGDPRYALVGTDSGGLYLLHAFSAAVVGSIPRAHGDAAVWSVIPAERGGRADAAPVMVSGGSDKTVKFWDVSAVGELPAPPRPLPSRRGEATKRKAQRKKRKAAAVTAGRDGDDSDDDIEQSASSSEDEDDAAAAAREAAAEAAAAGGVVLTRTLQLTEEVLCVRTAAPIASGGGGGGGPRQLLVSLLDATVRRFDVETLAPLGSLYGHALPVTSMSTSSDGVLVATASADRTVKVWGLDFGDCRRSLRAHTAAATAVVFQPATHYLFSGGRDGAVRYWDADTATHIADLEGHRGDVAALLLSGDGELLASASADGALRTWRRTDTPLFPEEEASRRADAAADTAIEADDATAAARARGGLEVGAPPSAVAAILDAGGEASAPVKRSVDAVAGGERLLAALTDGDGETDPDTGAPRVSMAKLLGRTPDTHVLATLESIRPADVEAALVLLPLHAAMRLLGTVGRLLAGAGADGAGDGDGNGDGDGDRDNDGGGGGGGGGVTTVGAGAASDASVELLVRVGVSLLHSHHEQVVGGALPRARLAALRDAMRHRVGRLEAVVGFGQAGLRFWADALAERDDAPFRDAAARVAIVKAAAAGGGGKAGGAAKKKKKGVNKAKRPRT
ncbi:hypothetical protein MMPV_007349 [Pyropia vietnamensis]